MKKKRIVSLLLAGAMLVGTSSSVFAAEGDKYTTTVANDQGIIYVYNEGGETLGYHKDSGVKLIVDQGYAFKDLNQNDKLDPYEDWRLDTATRAENLAGLMVNDSDKEGIQSIAGLMLYSSHTKITGPSIDNSGASSTVQVGIREALDEQYLRHVLVTSISSPSDAASWSNEVQAHVEGKLYGIPTNNSSDPRHSASSSNAEYLVGNSGSLSLWPQSIGLAATFDPDAVLEFGQIASAEYRALGISTALSPQIDLATDPRWSRFNGTFGEDSDLAVDMSRAYVDGFQSTYEKTETDGSIVFGEDKGWGSDSVNGMVKHWPGGGSGEGGRDAHFNYGKFAVYPGGNFDEHLLPFTEGAFKLNGKTNAATAVMPYYTISYGQDPSGDNVGNSYSRYIIQDLLRDEYKYTGVVCTDWNIVYDNKAPYSFDGMCWGMENDSITERFIRLLEVGIDQFGGVNTIENIMIAYDGMVKKSGVTEANSIMKQHAERLLTNIFNTGLFENPYLDVKASAATVGNSDFMAAGYETQQKSVVMLKNSNQVIAKNGLEGKKVYTSYANKPEDESSIAMFKNYWGAGYTDDIKSAEAAVIVIDSPDGIALSFSSSGIISGGYSIDDYKNGGNGYMPISLQYGEYTADTARDPSIAIDTWTSWKEIGIEKDVENRSYKGKTVKVESNIATLDNYKSITEAAEAAGIPVIVYMRASNPLVWSEIEPSADAIVVGYSVQTQAAFDIISGKVEPSAMLPMQQPANMETVEAQYEDVAHDMDCYKDNNGNTYDFGFGLNYSGVIGVDTKDARYDAYVANTNPPEPSSEESSEESPQSTAPSEITSSTTSTAASTSSTGKGTASSAKTGDSLPIMLTVAALGSILLATYVFKKRKTN